MRLLLGLLQGGVVLSLALFAPNAVGPIIRMFEKRRIPPKRARAVIHYLKRHNLVIVRESNGKSVVEITEAGRRKLREYDFEKLTIKRPKRWDGKWRLIAFDIPEKKKLARDALRRKLKELGFLQAQRSVWIHPFECRNEINFVAEVFRVSPYVWMFEAIAADHTDYLVAKFDLKRS
ncbi:MAG: hypothetical protein A3B37_01395 [Candidatus Sungbacteria bacterium RIFCSPLOWO2_01_FULL_59_16]|uniref:Transcriptional repressor PaaX-like central Cas2-like domain-containing protein n=1 Tax=Candidatus Sungbacteria bacterium RIFCSPLOWO2_01_FULL_59_16 TaxID=1802280 RepID=A0A1G2LEE8_9BACT|nr:MAG: hypothetical protein A3B37_01395 [Candidatus Sungbacteria bacterium RIFCSPLOWO2_01_FULL_59_16]